MYIYLCIPSLVQQGARQEGRHVCAGCAGQDSHQQGQRIVHVGPGPQHLHPPLTAFWPAEHLSGCCTSLSAPQHPAVVVASQLHPQLLPLLCQASTSCNLSTYIIQYTHTVCWRLTNRLRWGKNATKSKHYAEKIAYFHFKTKGS